MNLTLLIIFALGIIIGIVFSRHKKASLGLIERQRMEKEANKAKIMAYFAESYEGRGKLTNDDIQRLLGVSDATATRYMEELEREGKIRQVGETGRYVYYTSTSSAQVKE